ncbi:uncharacterized protein LOC133489907 isoform X6 [Phyllopteryx taeniolatus]|uniref:uncharacterized protein LOC133489907 isoform X6 n=1 Tax=Phyllopteryx taeniolatus TaxID=161469 RepID=UPI002AD42A58|nr:uncharacterized protein LOC133489907 isoform X6 [Phyllopteryx taeniolatus]
MQEVAKRAVLVSVANFEPGVSLGARHGAKEDTRRLHRVLSKLDFQVDIHQDLNSHEIYRLFRKVPCDHLHQSNVTTCVLGADGAPVWLSRVFAYFDRADVERMAKVFLIQVAGLPSGGQATPRDSLCGLQGSPQSVSQPTADALSDVRTVGTAGRHPPRRPRTGSRRGPDLHHALLPAADKLIGVHCTHGLNRTGYMICRYLIDVDGMDPAEAIKSGKLSQPESRTNTCACFQCSTRVAVTTSREATTSTTFAADPEEATRAWTTSVCRRRRKDEPTRDAPTVACLKTGVGAAPTDLSRQEPKVDAHPSGPIMKAPDITGPRISTPLNTPPSMSTTTPTNPLITAPSMSALSVASPHFWAAFFPHRPHSPLPTSTDRRCPVPPASWFGPETFGRPPRPPSLATPPVGAISKGVRMRGGAEISCGIF